MANYTFSFAQLRHPRPWTRVVKLALLTLAAVGLSAAAMTARASPIDWITSGAAVAGNGIRGQQVRTPGHFEGIALDTPGELELHMGDTDSITITSDGNLLESFETVIEHGTLRIRTRKNTRVAPTTLKFLVQARSINRLSISGAGTIKTDSLRTSALLVEIGGAGTVNLNGLDTDAAKVRIGGSGDLRAAGRADSLSVAIGGSGNVDSAWLKASDVNVSIGGSGQATVWARQALAISVAGSGDVRYYGDPGVSTSIVGSGKVKRLGAAPAPNPH